MSFLNKPPKVFVADCFDEAYRKGMFISTMMSDEIINKLKKVNPSLTVTHSNSTAQKKHLIGLHLKIKGEKKFITGMSYFNAIPRYTLCMPNGHVMIKGWESILKAFISADRRNERKYLEIFGC